MGASPPHRVVIATTLFLCSGIKLSLTNLSYKHWTVQRDKVYIVKAYDETGAEIEPWIDINIEDIEPTYLNRLG